MMHGIQWAPNKQWVFSFKVITYMRPGWGTPEHQLVYDQVLLSRCYRQENHGLAPHAPRTSPVFSMPSMFLILLRKKKKKKSRSNR